MPSSSPARLHSGIDAHYDDRTLNLRAIAVPDPSIDVDPGMRSIFRAHPFAPHFQNRGHDHRTEEKTEQSERLNSAENSDQNQEEWKSRSACDEDRLEDIVCDERDRRAEAEKSGGEQRAAALEI